MNEKIIRDLRGILNSGHLSHDEYEIICAAIRAADGSVLIGTRHYSRDMHAQIEARRDGEKFKRRHDPDQGFIDQHHVYMTREEAYKVAADAGQVLYPFACGEGLDGPKLYSEGLY